MTTSVLDMGVFDLAGVESMSEGEFLERGWEMRGNSSAIRRNAEVCKFAIKCAFCALKSKKLRKAGASEEDIEFARSDAAVFNHDGMLRLGPTR